MSSPILPDLPDGYRGRRPLLADASAILQVVHAHDVAVLGYPDFTIDDVRESLTAPRMDPDKDAWVVTAATGELVAWAYLWNPYGGSVDEFDVYVRPDAAAVQPALLDAVLGRIAERAAEWSRAELTAGTYVVVGDDAWAKLLEEWDFHARRRFSRMRIELTPGRPYPRPPAGVALRTFDPAREQDWADWHRVLVESFADHFEAEPLMLSDFRARIEAEPRQDFDTWWFADVQGGPAGILQSTLQYDEDNGGWVRNLGVLAEFRGRGIGRFLLEYALAAYAEQGRVWAGLGVDTDNVTGALRLYESVGMRPLFQADAYRRLVPAAR